MSKLPTQGTAEVNLTDFSITVDGVGYGVTKEGKWIGPDAELAASLPTVKRAEDVFDAASFVYHNRAPVVDVDIKTK